jgi:hypothetical protein
MFDAVDLAKYDLHHWPRTTDAARDWLRQLYGSPLGFHLDDDPRELEVYTDATARFLVDGVQECRELLGEPEMWEAYEGDQAE